MIKTNFKYATATITEYENHIDIENLEVKIKRRGNGTRMMNRIIKYAEKIGKNIELYSYPQDFSISETSLRDFYLGLGFNYHQDDSDFNYLIY